MLLLALTQFLLVFDQVDPSEDSKGEQPEVEEPKTVFSELKNFLALWVPA